MKSNVTFYLSSIALSAILVSCSSTVTMADVNKQKEAANEAIAEAQEELVTLAEVKEQYSKDGVTAQAKELRKEQKKIDKDIAKLKDLNTDAATDGAKSTVKSLEDKSKALGEEITRLKNIPEEDWSKAVETINRNIADLKAQVEQITQNLK